MTRPVKPDTTPDRKPDRTPGRRKSPSAPRTSAPRPSARTPAARKPKPAAAPVPADRYAEAEAELARRIRAWAETWRRCPLKLCRRRGACTRDDDCCGVEPGPVVFTEAERRTIREALDAVCGPRRGPLYDGDAREREAPMPPAPRRG